MAKIVPHPTDPSVEYMVNDDGSYMTQLEIAYQLFNGNQISKEDVEFFTKLEFHHLIMHHLTFGMWIRNTFGLWHESNPYTNANIDEQHPDTVSYRVMQMYHKLLHGKSPDPQNPSLIDTTF